MCLIVTYPSVSGYLGFKLGWETDVNSFKLTSRDWFVTSTKVTVRILSSMCTSEANVVLFTLYVCVEGSCIYHRHSLVTFELLY